MTNQIVSTPRDVALRYERLLVDLADMFVRGMADEPAADVLRDQMDVLTKDLTPAEVKIFDDLSAALYMIQLCESFDVAECSRDELMFRALHAFRDGDWLRTLRLLRQGPDFHRRDYIAYFRSRCYASLGFRNAASAFMDYAAKLSPGTPEFVALAVDYAWVADRPGAVERAARVLSDPSTDAQAVIFAATVLSSALRETPQRANDSHIDLILAYLPPKLAELERSRSAVVEFLVVGYATLGIWRHARHDLKGAAEATEEVLRLAPSHVLTRDEESELRRYIQELRSGNGSPNPPKNFATSSGIRKFLEAKSSELAA